MNQLPSFEHPSVSIAGSKLRFPARRIDCVGRNYAEHVREMGKDPSRDFPFFFCKPADAVVQSGCRLAFPSRTQDLQHEVELVVALGEGGSTVSVDGAREMAALSSFVELAPGDLIFTGTPSGVGPIRRGDTVRGTITDLAPIEVSFEP